MHSQYAVQQTPVSMLNPTAKASLAYETMAARLLGKEESERQPQKRGMAAFFHISLEEKKMLSKFIAAGDKLGRSRR